MSQVAAEKPNPTIFLKACELLDVKPEDAVHVGDDRRNDIWGARDAGCDAWLWGSDVHSFKEVCCKYRFLISSVSSSAGIFLLSDILQTIKKHSVICMGVYIVFSTFN